MYHHTLHFYFLLAQIITKIPKKAFIECEGVERQGCSAIVPCLTSPRCLGSQTPLLMVQNLRELPQLHTGNGMLSCPTQAQVLCDQV